MPWPDRIERCRSGHWSAVPAAPKLGHVTQTAPESASAPEPGSLPEPTSARASTTASATAPASVPATGSPSAAAGGPRQRRLHRAWSVAAVAFVTITGAAAFASLPGLLIEPLHGEFMW